MSIKEKLAKEDGTHMYCYIFQKSSMKNFQKNHFLHYMTQFLPPEKTRNMYII